MTFDTDALRALETRISASAGVSVEELRELLYKAFTDTRSDKDVSDFRLGKRRWKKLRDEVAPVSGLLSFLGIEGRVLFPLDNNVPDCWLTLMNGSRIGIEVTRALGRSDYELAKEMDREGIGRGFLGVQDTASSKEFERALSRKRTLYSTSQALSHVRNGISQCLSNKNVSKYEGMWLLIAAPLKLLPQERWRAIEKDLVLQSAQLPFDKVFVMCGSGSEPWGFCIK